MRIVVVLPAPLEPQKPNIEPGRDGEADAVEHVVVAEALVQPVELEHRVLPSSLVAARNRIGRPRSRAGRFAAVSSAA